MNPPIVTQFANPDPAASPLNLTQLIQLLNVLISSEMQGSYIPYVIQNATPSVDDQDKAWIYLDSQGRPVETRIYYNGIWRRIYNGMLGEIRLYNGDPAVDFDANGLGNVGGIYDGWHLCNGKDGVPDLSDQFPIAAHMNNADIVGYDGEWKTTILGAQQAAHTGGGRDFTLNASNTYRPATQEIVLYEWSATGNVPANPGDLYGLHNVGSKSDTLQNGDAGNLTPDSVSIIPKFIALAYIQFVGYAAI